MDATFTNDTNKLTEFKPLTEDTQPRIVDIISRIFSKPPTENELTQQTAASAALSTGENSNAKPLSSGAHHSSTDILAINNCRSLNSPSERIVSLLSMPIAFTSSDQKPQSSSGLLDYEQSDFRQYWMPDAKCKQCFECGDKFTTFKRRHHCRICGQIFCSKCCRHEISGRLLGYIGNLRLCNYCSEAVTTYLNNTCPSADHLPAEHKLSSTNSLKTRTGSLTDLRPTPRKMSPAPDLSKPLALNCNDQYNRKKSFRSNILTQRRSIDNFIDASLDDGISAEQYPSIPENRLTGVQTSQLLPSGLSTIQSSSSSSNLLFDDLEPDWVKNIQTQLAIDEKRRGSMTSTCEVASVADDGDQHATALGSLDANIVDDIVSSSSSRSYGVFNDFTDSASFVEEFVQPVAKLSIAAATELQIERRLPSPDRTDPLLDAFEQHALRLIDYLLRTFDLPQSEWVHVIWPLVREIAFTVQPDVRSRQDDMDASAYVHIKTLLDSDYSKPSVRVVFGTVCNKALADSRMKSSFAHPKIMLISGSIEYERIEGKFCSLDPVLLQEFEHLRSVVFKIVSRKPNVVVVEKSVARIAQTLLREAGITLICNVKKRVLDRLARCTQADIIHSVEGQIMKPKLGICGSLKVESVKQSNKIPSSRGFDAASFKNAKSLLYFEDCPPDLACTLVFSGPNFSQLKRMKRIVRLCVQQLYSAKLEMAMLRSFDFRFEPISCGKINETSVFCEICDDRCADSAPMTPKRKNAVVAKIRQLPASKASEIPVFYASPFIKVTLPDRERLLDLETQEKNTQTSDSPVNRAETAVDESNSTEFDCFSIDMDDAHGDQLGFLCDDEIPAFFSQKIVKSINSVEMKRDLAYFRAFGGVQLRRRCKKAAHVKFSNVENIQDDYRMMISTVPCYLNPWFHQRLAVSYSSYLTTPASDRKILGFCLKPTVFVMHFYGKFDCTLGDYLDRYCFDQSYQCANDACDANMLNHVRKLVHGSRCIEITVQSVNAPETSPSTVENDHQSIFTWDYCPRCKTASTIAEPSVNALSRRMSRDFYHLSFAKFIDYLLNGQQSVLQYQDRGSSCNDFGNVLDRKSDNCVNDEDGSANNDVDDDRCRCCKLHARTHHFARGRLVATFKTSSVHLRDVILPLGNASSYGDDNVVETNISSDIVANPQVDDVIEPSPAIREDTTNVSKGSVQKPLSLDDNSATNIIVSDFDYALSRTKCDTERIAAVLDSASDILTKLNEFASQNESLKCLNQLIYTLQNIVENYTGDDTVPDNDYLKLVSGYSPAETCLRKATRDKIRLSEMVQRWNLSINDWLSQICGPKKKFDDKLHPSGTKQHKETNLPYCEQSMAFGESTERDSSASTIVQSELSPVDDSQSNHNCNFKDQSDVKDEQMRRSESLKDWAVETTPLSATERKSLTKILSTSTLTSPFDPNEHYALPTAVGWAPVVIREGEAGSIVAYAFCSEEYRRACIALRETQLQNNVLAMRPNLPEHGGSQAECGVNHSPHIELQFSDQSAKFYCKIFFAERFRAIRRRSLIGCWREPNFSEQSEPSIGVEDDDDWVERRFIESLSRCDKWTPKGGKSGAIFQRTADKRFILKQISRFELQSFQKFAADYFHYVEEACRSNRTASALARIYGMFRVGLTNLQTSTAFKMDFIVMEYLFYGRDIGKVYDLKGSVRNRLANLRFDGNFAPKRPDDSLKPNSALSGDNDDQPVEDVLLDVNLLRDVAQHTFYLLPRARRALDSALRADTHFLSSNHVMDYSLLCAVDKQTPNRLILGVIDYVRTYSWDKRVESWVKSTVTINNQLPTVVSPEIYRQRLIDIMDVYFPVVPDRWTNVFDI